MLPAESRLHATTRTHTPMPCDPHTTRDHWTCVSYRGLVVRGIGPEVVTTTSQETQKEHRVDQIPGRRADGTTSRSLSATTAS